MTGSYTFNGGGDDIWSCSDNFDFAHYTVVGDFDLRVRVESVEPVARWTKAGIMARELLTPNSRMAFNRVTPGDVVTGTPSPDQMGANDTRFSYRTGTSACNEGEHEDGTGNPAYPNEWLRLVRSGNVITAYRSVNGESWSQQGNSQDTATWNGGALPASLYLGLAVSRHGSAPDTIATVEFENFGPTPVAIASQPANTTVSAGQSANFSVSVPSGFGSYVTYQWLENGLPIVGATSSSYTKTAPLLLENGNTYSVVVSNRLNAQTLTSSAAVMTVMANPQIVSVGTRGDTAGVYVTFSKAMDNTTTLNTANYAIDGGVTVSGAAFVGAGNSTVRLAVSGLVFGATNTITISGVQDAEANAIVPDPTVATFVHGANMTAPAALTLKRYQFFGGGAVSDLRNNPSFPCSPAVVNTEMASVEYGTDPTPRNTTDTFINDYGAWIYGIFTPAVSGNYRFGISSDDGSELALSTDASPANKVVITSQCCWNNERTYTDRITGDIYLEAGRGYYLEVLHKEGGGGDHVSVALQEPGGPAIVDGQAGFSATNFVPRYSYGCPPTAFFQNLGPIAVIRNPSDTTVIELSSTAFDIDLDGSGPHNVQWYKNGTPISGANKTRLTIVGNTNDNGATFYAIVNNDFSSATSSVATLTVTPAPQLVSANTLSDPNGIYVKFSKPMGANAAHTSNYTVSGGVTVTGASFWSADTIRVGVSTLAGGGSITVKDVQDVDGNTLAPNPSTVNFSHFSGTFSNTFNSLPAGSTLYGNARLDAGILKLTDAVNSQNGAWLLEDFSGGAFIDRFVATWRANIGSGSATPADGYSFNVGNNVPTGTYGEEGAGTGLIISFDTYDNGGAEAPAIDIRVNGQTVHRLAPFQVVRPGFVNVSVTLDADGTLDLVYDGTVIASDVQTGFVPGTGVKWGFGGRTGGLNQNNWIDDLSIKIFEAGPVTIAAQPSSTTVNENDLVSWKVIANGSLPQTVQWYSNSVAIPGATQPIYSFRPLRFANGATYTVVVSNLFSGVTSVPWTLNVVSDMTAPVLTKAVGSFSHTEATVTFSEQVNLATATNIANYIITNSAGAILNVTDARAISDRIVILTTDEQAHGERYTVVVNGVTDIAGVPNPVAAGSTASFSGWVFTPGFALMEVYNSIGGGDVFQLRASPKYPYFPDERYYLTSVDSRGAYPNDSHDNYGARITGLFIPPTNGNYVITLRNDDGVEFAASGTDKPSPLSVLVAAPCCNGTFVPASPATPLAGGDRYYYELTWKEGGGGDYAAASIDAANPVGTALMGIYADPDATQLYLSNPPQNQTRVPNAFASFNVRATNTAGFPQSYQWQIWDAFTSTFTNVPGANGTNLTLGPLVLEDDGTQVRVLVYTPGASNSAVATLSVVNDTVLPRVVSARADSTFKRVIVTFSEAMDLNTATEPLYYAFTDSEGNLLEYLQFSGGAFEGVGNSNVVLTLADDIVLPENTLITVYADGMNDANGNSMDSTANSTTFRTMIRSRGFARFDFYTGIGGGTISALLSAPTYPNSPNFGFITNRLEWPQTTPDLNDYGLRMSGFFVPQVSGDHTFALKYDDDARFSMSTNADPANLRQVIAVGCCSGAFAGNTVVPGLVAGQPYYFEALVKEAGGGDYLTVGVQPPGASSVQPVTGQYLMMVVDPATGPNMGFAQHPQNRSVDQFMSATFTALATNAGPNGVLYQWQYNDGSGWTDIAGANGTSYTTPPAQLAQDGWQIRAVAYGLGTTIISDAATLTVVPDVTAPGALIARGVRANNAVTVTFSDLMDPETATNGTFYALTDTNGVSLNILGASLSGDGRSVTLQLDPATPTTYATVYDIVITDSIKDLAGNNIATTNLLFQTWTVSMGAAWFEAYLNVGGGTAVTVLTNHVDYPNNPQFARHVRGMDTRPAYPDDSHENYGGRVSGYLVPPVSGNYIFYIKSDDASELWLSTDSNPANRVLLTAETGCCTPYSAHTSAQVPLVAGQLYYIEAIYKEGGGGDFVQAAAKLAIDSSNPDNLPPISGAYLASLADPMGASITVTQQPVNKIVAQYGSTTFTAGATGVNAYNTADVVIQWQKSTDNGATWSNIYGANGNSFNTGELGAADHNSQYRAMFYIPGAALASAAATVSIDFDVVKPTIVSAVRPAATPAVVRVTFSERLDIASAGNFANYSIPGATITNATVSTAVVTLTLDAPLSSGTHYLTVNNVADRAGNAIQANSQTEIYVYTARQPVSGTLVMEAEQYDNNQPGSNAHFWEFSNTAVGLGTFSGSGYMVCLPNGVGTSPGDGDTSGARLDYAVNFPSAGTWYVWLRGLGENGSDNSCHIGLNGVQSPMGYQIGNGTGGWTNNAWRWVRDRNGVEIPPAQITVTNAGIHTFSVWQREDGLRLDKILITSDAAYNFADRTEVGPAGTPVQLSMSQAVITTTTSAGGDPVLQWASPGRLQSADEITGPWTDVPGATSPFTVDPDLATRKFFRVIR